MRLAGSPLLFARTASRGRWIPAKHLQLLNSELIDIAAGHNDRLLVSMPPRHGKSELISKYFPAWYLGINPDHRVMLCGYSDAFAKQWGRAARNLLDRWGGELFDGVRTADDSSAANLWNLEGHEGGMQTAGVGGGITGRGAHLLILDDPIKNAEDAVSEVMRETQWQWWQSTALTRLEPGGAIVVIGTRWHNDDLIGRILRNAQESGERWRNINLAAIAEDDEYHDGRLLRRRGEALWPERFSVETLDRKRRSMSPYWWRAMYCGAPSTHERAEWPEEYFGDSIWFDADPDPVDVQLKVMTLDPSKGKSDKKGDYSAIVCLSLAADGTMYVSADLARRDPRKIVDDMLVIGANFKPDVVVVESNQYQEVLVGMIAERSKASGMMLPVWPLVNTVNKVVRIRATLSPYLARGEIRFRRGTHGCELLVQQLRDFPLAAHDDGPDALEMAIRETRRLYRDGLEPHEEVQHV